LLTDLAKYRISKRDCGKVAGMLPSTVSTSPAKC
jgi:hypothetical protein